MNTKTRAPRPPFVKTGRMPRGMRPVSTTFIHVPAGARTRDLRIKSPLLYQLSYRDDIPLTTGKSSSWHRFRIRGPNSRSPAVQKNCAKNCPNGPARDLNIACLPPVVGDPPLLHGDLFRSDSPSKAFSSTRCPPLALDLKAVGARLHAVVPGPRDSRRARERQSLCAGRIARVPRSSSRPRLVGVTRASNEHRATRRTARATQPRACLWSGITSCGIALSPRGVGPCT
jgi:hypothetical protein